jgi:hypothetical protein
MGCTSPGANRTPNGEDLRANSKNQHFRMGGNIEILILTFVLYALLIVLLTFAVGLHEEAGIV